ncbi:MAG: hypothetical protein IK016_08615 [Lachnospiraceae bacterium]|nr:hypothetical protein [Lachnospiraceae bacterium]
MASFFDFNGDGKLGVFEKACRDAIIFSVLFDHEEEDDKEDDKEDEQDDEDGWFYL